MTGCRKQLPEVESRREKVRGRGDGDGDPLCPPSPTQPAPGATSRGSTTVLSRFVQSLNLRLTELNLGCWGFGSGRAVITHSQGEKLCPLTVADSPSFDLLSFLAISSAFSSYI